MSESRVPEGWESVELETIGKIITGSTPPTSNRLFYGGKFMFVSPADIKENKYITRTLKTLTTQGFNQTRKLPKNTLLVTCIGELGKVAISKEYLATNQQINAVICNSSYYYGYFYYAIIFNKNKLKTLAGLQVVPLVNKKQFSSISVLAPKSKNEQQKIAEILSEVDSAIEKTKELIEKNRRLKTALMQDLLNYGIDENGQIRNPKTHQFKPSPLGDIPVEWEVKKIGEIYKELKTGATPSRSNPEYFKGDTLWVTSGELKYKVITDTVEKITQKAVHDTNLKIYPAGTFFIAITGLEAVGTRGSCAIIGKEATTNQSCMAFVANKEIDTLYLFQYYLLHGEYLSLYYAQGSKQQSLNNKIVAQILIHVPPLTEQQKIADILSSQDEKIEKLQNKLNKLKHLKISLMQDLLSGKVRVNKLLESKQ